VNATILLGLIVLLAGSYYAVRSRRISGERSHERDALAQFLASFSGRRLPESLLRHSFTYLLERSRAAGDLNEQRFVVAPGHDLRTVYHLDDLDIEDAALVIADRARVRLPRAHELDELRHRVRTVQDLVEFLEPYFLPQPVDG
jgi:hypothetical protein